MKYDLSLTASDNVCTEEHNIKNCVSEPIANETTEIPSVKVIDGT